MKRRAFIARVGRKSAPASRAGTGEYQYTIDQVSRTMIKRANEMNLRLKKSEGSAKLDFTIMITVQTHELLHSGRHRVAL
jgi:hypothetical protein